MYLSINVIQCKKGENMFGYINCDETQLTAQDRDVIGSFYCGLCMALKQHFGNKARIFTNIDCTYAFMLISSVSNIEIDIQKKRCFLHPLSKRNIAYVDNELSQKIASATILISYYKLLDDCKDEKRNLTKKTMRSMYKKIAEKAKANLPNFDTTLAKMLNATQKLEKDTADNLFALMDISGQILSAMALNCNAEPLQNLFYHLGQFVYFLDALDDYEKDIKKKRYNALCYHLGNFTTKKELLINKSNEINAIFENLYQNLNDEYNNLKPEDDSNTIFDNLFTLGLKKCYRTVLSQRNN